MVCCGAFTCVLMPWWTTLDLELCFDLCLELCFAPVVGAVLEVVGSESDASDVGDASDAGGNWDNAKINWFEAMIGSDHNSELC